MRRLLAVLAILAVLSGAVYAADEISVTALAKKIPATEQGISYSLVDSKIAYLTTLEVFKWGPLDLEAGYSSTNRAVVLISADLFQLKDYGVDIPIIKYVGFRPGIYAGIGRITLDTNKAEGNNEFDWGICATFIRLKF